MKKIIIIFFTFVLFTFSYHNIGTTEEQKSLNPASLIPSSAASYFIINEIEKTIKDPKSIMHNIKTYNWFTDFFKKIEIFTNKTGIDLLNSKSLINAGINIKNPLSIAVWKKDTKREWLVLFIPVKDKKNFYLKFIDILKKGNTIPNIDLKPEITNYKKYIIGKALEDIFFTSIDNYFILAPCLKLIKKIIDLQINESNEISLLEDQLYKQYIQQNYRSNDYDIDIFMKRDFLLDTILKDTIICIPERENITNSTATDSSHLKKNKKNYTKFNYIDYLGVGMKSDPEEMKIGISLALNPEGQDLIYLQDLFRIGSAEKAIYFKDSLLYYFSSINFKGFDDLIKYNSNTKKYKDFIVLKKGIKQDLNIHLADIFFPNSTLIFNYMIEQPRNIKNSENFVLFIPDIKTNHKKTWKNIWEKIKKNIKYGSKMIKGIEAFWFKNKRGEIINIFMLGNGFCISNNVKCMVNAIDNQKKSITEIDNYLFHTIDSNTFLAMSFDFEKESMIKMICRLLLFSRPELLNLLESNNNITVIGKRKEHILFFDIRTYSAKSVQPQL